MAWSVSEPEGWKRMVLQSMVAPAWLALDAPYGDIVLSSRVRLMRNLRGFRFPNRASDLELEAVMMQVRTAADASGLPLEPYRSLTNAERDYFVGCRLVAPDFPWTLPSRMLLVDRDRSLSIMVNEEDHLRLQALTAGWSITNAAALARHALDRLERSLEFAYSPVYGYLGASPYNTGSGRRQSAMFHLIGLAQTKRLKSVLTALGARGLSVRGLFGESSRAIGAYAQVSLLNGEVEDFVGACEYLIRQEREARAEVGRETLEEKAEQAFHFANRSRLLSLADALRILAWVRWAASAGAAGTKTSFRACDEALTRLELGNPGNPEESAKRRAVFVRSALGLD